MIKKTNSVATKKDVLQVRNELKKDIKKLDSQVDKLDKKVVGLDEKVDKLDKKTDSLDRKINGLDKKIDGVELSLREEIRLSITETEERIDEKAREYRDQILTKMDGFLKEINASRQERVLVSEKQAEHSDRIERLETAVFPS